MRRLVTLMLSLCLAVGAVASAETVQAPVIKEAPAWEHPDKTGLVPYRPLAALNPVQAAYLAELGRRAGERVLVVQEAQGGKCPEWAGLAFDVGWPAPEIPRLLGIIWRESRCRPDACSQSDSGRVCRDWGLTQINEYSWRRTLTNMGYQMSDMWQPKANLTFALWLFNYSQDRTGCGWTPWAGTC